MSGDAEGAQNTSMTTLVDDNMASKSPSLLVGLTFTIVTLVCLLVFLGFSFIMHHRRRVNRRKHERENQARQRALYTEESRKTLPPIYYSSYENEAVELTEDTICNRKLSNESDARQEKHVSMETIEKSDIHLTALVSIDSSASIQTRNKMGKKKASKSIRMKTNVENNAGVTDLNNLKENKVIHTAEIHGNNIDEYCTTAHAQNLKLQGVQDDVKGNTCISFSLGRKDEAVLRNAQIQQTTCETDLIFPQVTHI